ncbi:putative uncharacterized protein [Rhodococcus sp. AW25M09]|nr:putative uncharacterized protein [Rhodococcus sp. AW25M09]
MRAHVEALRNNIHRVDDVADEIMASQLRGHKAIGQWRGRRGRQKFEVTGHRKLSPGAAENPSIRDAIDHARLQKRTVAEPNWMKRRGFDYAHSNLADRRALPYRAEGYDLSGVHALDSQADRARIRASLEAASMGEPGACVVLIDPGVARVIPGYPLRLWEGELEPCAVTFPVPHGYTGLRIAAQVVHRYASRCRWCDTNGATPSEGLVVSAGSTAYVFPTCRSCHDDLESFFDPAASPLDFVSNDGEQHAMGWPADWWF